MSLSPPGKVRKLQAALHAKAKGLPDYRFYALYDKLYRADVLAHAYACCKANRGAAGVDGQGFDDIEAYGVERWLGELAAELRNKTYRPRAVRRVYIPKANGKQRPLGIPTIRDRVAQMACVLVLDPIYEADVQPEQYAYHYNEASSACPGRKPQMNADERRSSKRSARAASGTEATSPANGIGPVFIRVYPCRFFGAVDQASL